MKDKAKKLFLAELKKSRETWTDLLDAVEELLIHAAGHGEKKPDTLLGCESKEKTNSELIRSLIITIGKDAMALFQKSQDIK